MVYFINIFLDIVIIVLQKVSVWLGFILDSELKFSLAKCFISKQMFRLLYTSLYQCYTDIKYQSNKVYSYGFSSYTACNIVIVK